MSKLNKILLYILIIKLVAVIIAMFISYEPKEEETLIEYKYEGR